MKIHENEVDILIGALEVILEMTNENETKFTQNDKQFIAELMRKHISKADIQILGCRLLAVLATDGKRILILNCMFLFFSL